ncbi:hypothetical protein B0J12DRAFT_35853 [Macrophomina phaseolina]|uniref:Uncharacterized protein n=1 Tax=Macrophomina phaseolina TaxID=35725 RepID=A0ABQ8GVY4_9PEZI|nr:hypothetical protein B0J12DRAFT_35853 [Macrophomina phaseolina]
MPFPSLILTIHLSRSSFATPFFSYQQCATIRKDSEVKSKTKDRQRPPRQISNEARYSRRSLQPGRHTKRKYRETPYPISEKLRPRNQMSVTSLTKTKRDSKGYQYDMNGRKKKKKKDERADQEMTPEMLHFSGCCA